MSRDFIVTIGGARGEEWKRVLGTNQFCVVSAMTSPGTALGRPGSFYFMDLETLNAEDRSTLVKHLAGKFHLSVEQVEADIAQYGVPILADDCQLTVLNLRRI